MAITRAGNRCALTFAKSRFRNGNTEFSRPSRFLRELDPRLIEQGSASISGSYGSSPFGNSSYGSSPFGNRTQSSYSGNSSSYGSRPSSSPMNLQRKAAYPGPSQSRPSTSTTSASSSFSSIENPRAWKKMPTQTSVSSTVTTPAAAAQAIQSSKGTFVVGQKVLHDRFGEGLIKSIEGQGDNCKIGVEFVHAGFKMLLLKFASMRPID